MPGMMIWKNRVWFISFCLLQGFEQQDRLSLYQRLKFAMLITSMGKRLAWGLSLCPFEEAKEIRL
jgi:hypothetical protein